MVELVLVDLDDRVAVVRAADDATPGFPHALRGTLTAMLAEPAWHVVVAFDGSAVPRDTVVAVLDDANAWAEERGCRLTVSLGGEASPRWQQMRDVFP